MDKWGNVRVLSSVITDVKTSINNNPNFSNISDFVQFLIRQELNKKKRSKR